MLANLRQWFIEEREDGKQDMIYYDNDPGSCRYKELPWMVPKLLILRS